MSIKEEFGAYGGYIPYHCEDCGEYFTLSEDEDDICCPKCGSVTVEDLEEANLARVCTHCGKIMKEGYMIDGGNAYYCSDECMDAHYTPEEKAAALEDAEGDGNTYWTEWEG